jgi:predicted TIM-barrel fold metal-dependent hydrolase
MRSNSVSRRRRLHFSNAGALGLADDQAGFSDLLSALPSTGAKGNAKCSTFVDAGFEDRVMFGTDPLVWPKLMAYSISIIQNADYLTPQQKRDILYNNAARFLQLDTAKSN